MVALPLKYVCTPYLLQIFLQVFPQSLYKGYHYVACTWLILVGPDFCACRIVRSLCWVSSWLLFFSWLLLMSLVVNILIYVSHLGYLHFARASLRCSNSSLRSSGVVHTVLALWIRVPMTLYLAARL